MKEILINNDGYVSSPSVQDATIVIKVSDEIYEKVSQVSFGKRWKFFNGNVVEEAIMDDESLRIRRSIECFKIIDNRSPLWYDRLTIDQKTELNNWYEAWLIVTETKIIPTKPTWLN